MSAEVEVDRITTESIDTLRARLCEHMSEKRLKHVLAVEQMAVRLGTLYAPGDENERLLRAAALLHDITKEYTVEQHLAVCSRYGLAVGRYDLASPKTFHARTAAAIIPDDYPELDDKGGIVVGAVRWHTTGRADMTVHEKIVYLADYIDETRRFADCVALRTMFWDADPVNMTQPEREEHLRRVLIASFDMTLKGLIASSEIVNPDTVDARNWLITDVSCVESKS